MGLFFLDISFRREYKLSRVRKNHMRRRNVLSNLWRGFRDIRHHPLNALGRKWEERETLYQEISLFKMWELSQRTHRSNLAL